MEPIQTSYQNSNSWSDLEIPTWVKVAGGTFIGVVFGIWQSRRSMLEVTPQKEEGKPTPQISVSKEYKQLELLPEVSSPITAAHLLGRCFEHSELFEGMLKEANKRQVAFLFEAALDEKQVAALLQALDNGNDKWAEALNGLDANQQVKADAVAGEVHLALSKVGNRSAWIVCCKGNMGAKGAWSGKEEAKDLISDAWGLKEPVDKALVLAGLFCNANSNEQAAMLKVLMKQPDKQAALLMGVINRLRTQEDNLPHFTRLRGAWVTNIGAILQKLSLGDRLALYLTYKSASRLSETYKQSLLDALKQEKNQPSSGFPFPFTYAASFAPLSGEVDHFGAISGDIKGAFWLLDYYAKQQQGALCVAFLEGVTHFSFNQIGDYEGLLNHFESLSLTHEEKATCAEALAGSLGQPDALKGVNMTTMGPKLINLFNKWGQAIPESLQSYQIKTQ